MDQFVLIVGNDGRVSTQQDVHDDPAAPDVRLGCDVPGDILGGSQDSPAQTLLDDFFDPEYFGNAEVLNSDGFLLLAIE